MDVNETFVPGTESESETNWYDQFLADYDFQRPKTGQLLEGTIIQVREDSLLIDVGLKRDAVVPSKDLALIDKEILENISAGDTVLVSVLQPSNINQGLLVSLNKGIQHKNWDQAEINLLNGNSLELEIIGQNRGGLLVQYQNYRN
jgi:ribosomal protein S1